MPDPSTVLVTGATSGIGAATARAFAGAGWHVVATGRRADRLDVLADELGRDRVTTSAFDIADAAARDAALAALPPVDLLVNNAGLARGTAPAQEADVSGWMEMIDTNVKALVAVTHALLPGLIERQGAIINLSSIAASYPYPGGNVYGGTKAFVRQFSLGLRADLAGTGVRVTSIEPGMVETDFTLVRTGSREKSDALYKGAHPITADDLAATLLWIAQLPPHLNVNTFELMPVTQSFGALPVARDEA